MHQPKEAFPDTITPGLEGAGCFPLFLPYLVLTFTISLTVLVIRFLDMSVSPSKLRCWEQGVCAIHLSTLRAQQWTQHRQTLRKCRLTQNAKCVHWVESKGEGPRRREKPWPVFWVRVGNCPRQPLSSHSLHMRPLSLPPDNQSWRRTGQGRPWYEQEAIENASIFPQEQEGKRM